MLLQDSGLPRSSVSQWVLDCWNLQLLETLDIIGRGRDRTEPGAIWRHRNGENSNSGSCCFRGGNQETRTVNKNGSLETHDPDREILETLGLAALISVKETDAESGEGIGNPLCCGACSYPGRGFHSRAQRCGYGSIVQNFL